MFLVGLGSRRTLRFYFTIFVVVLLMLVTQGIFSAYPIVSVAAAQQQRRVVLALCAHSVPPCRQMSRGCAFPIPLRTLRWSHDR
jgi:hypothetical protein